MEMTAEMANLVAGVVAMRPFVPASDLEMSREFYEALGFEAFPLGDDLASMHLGEFKFLLQRFSAPGLADNFMMHLLVRDVDAWLARIKQLDLVAKFGVNPPIPPKMQPWGLRVAYVIDPSGVLWHFAEERKS